MAGARPTDIVVELSRIKHMNHLIGGICGAAALLVFTANVPAAMAEAPRSRCGLLSHDVANLNAVNPRHAYWCKSDAAGYLDEDWSGHIRPYYAHARQWRHHHRRDP